MDIFWGPILDEFKELSGSIINMMKEEKVKWMKSSLGQNLPTLVFDWRMVELAKCSLLLQVALHRNFLIG